ncbi:Protein T23B5.3 a, partial [Aphelenchoides avenae]
QLPSDPQHHQHHRSSGEPQHTTQGVGSPSYTEHWANQLPKWSSESSFEASKSSLPPIGPLSNPPSKPPQEAPTHYQRRPSNGSPASLTRGQSLSGSHGELRRLQQLHDSTTSLNSSGHRPPTDGGSACEEDERERSRRKAIEAQHVLEQQNEEKRRMEARQAEAERRELERIGRERQILEERERKQAEDENNRWKKRQDVADNHEKSLLEAIEEAKREAEALKKMKLYKHVLQSPDCSPDVAKKILGTDDDRLASHVMRQVNEFERQKRLEREMQHNSPSGSARDSPRTARPPHGTPPDQGRAQSLPPKSPATPQTPPHASSKPPLVSSDSVAERSPPSISRNGFGRSSVRTPSAKKSVVPLRRSGSGERTYTPAATTRRSPQRRASPEKKPPTPVVPADPTNGALHDLQNTNR